MATSWTDNDVKFYTASANKAGAYSWLSNETKEMYVKRKFILHVVGMLIAAVSSGWGVVVGFISKSEQFLAISMIVTSIITLVGITLNNIDKLLDYDDEIQNYTLLMEANQLFYWDIYRTLQAVTSGTIVDKNIFKGTMDERESQLIKKFRPFPQKIIDLYYVKFGDQAVDYNVLFNDKIDPTVLATYILPSANSNERRDSIKDGDNITPVDDSTESPCSSPNRIPTLNIVSEMNREQMQSTLHLPEQNSVFAMHDRVSSPRPNMTLKKTTITVGGIAKKKLTPKQQFELDKYIVNFED